MDTEFLLGITECLVSTALYGSAFVPIKPFFFGDGVYSLQIRSVAVLVLGICVTCVRGSFHFYPVVMIGGAFWTIANLIVLPCIGELGLAVTVLLYSFTNCLTNWVTGYYGLFWTKARPPTTVWLNYIGLVFLLIGGLLIAFIRSPPKKAKATVSNSSSIQTIVPSKTIDSAEFEDKQPETTSAVNKHGARRLIAIAFALLAGFFYGENVTPVVHVQDHPDLYPDAPQDGLSYCLSHYMGIFLTASLIFFVYSIAKKNKPFVSAELTVPSFLSGLIWGTAQTLFIVATKNLSQSVCGPIGAILPGCIASCWSLFYFKEINGTRSIVMLILSISVTALGATCIAVSKNL
ncbi:unnamed protein product [Bursaphelenchus xylophilus]|uniref:(pine wood nematode) hypothetical protein n=1 Tax=Bursaphelenchus xylophilus TaxID=6326 RepID=A0A1I7RIU4_BURXY|nr:unnamed protein product [Bursaphelenchus xylophilus]CAG9119098.1 unnamed protein product [Bursaphelenchus xylophilus]